MRATERRLWSASHPDCRGHQPFAGHPERAPRLDAALAGAQLAGAEPIAVTVDEEQALAAISRVHAPALPARLRAACESGPSVFDSPDNPISRGTYHAAVAAVAATLAAVEHVTRDDGRSVFAAVRPPGHHALRNRAMGFCFFNNAAIAAEELLARGYSPVAVVDFDVHHGNGTQAHFIARPDVFYLSVHRFPFYPGSGAGDEIGVGQGITFTRNLPLAGGADDDVYAGAVEAGLADVHDVMSPAAWVVSAGFDAHQADPLGGMCVTERGFARIGTALRAAIAATPLVAVLEGGYNLEALQGSVQAFLEGLQGHAAS